MTNSSRSRLAKVICKMSSKALREKIDMYRKKCFDSQDIVVDEAHHPFINTLLMIKACNNLNRVSAIYGALLDQYAYVLDRSIEALEQKNS